MDRKIVDFHAHAFHDKIAAKAARNLNEYYGIPLAGDGTFQVLLDDKEKHGIDTLVVHATATKAEQVQVINDYVAGLIAPGIIGFGTIHPDYTDFSGELQRVKDLGLRGIKLHPIFQGFAVNAPVMLPIYREIARLGLPLLVHMGDKNCDGATPWRLAEVLEKVPELIVIAPHLGGVYEWAEAQKHLYGRKNVYLDTSSAMRFMEPEEVLNIIHTHGADRVLFGTDYPLSLYEYELKKFDGLGLTEEEAEAILWKNAYRLLNLGA
ncbi:MAG: amidohydrolase [Clostridia bacterium]|nr:amidohydrolase [Clostridia bacterium]